VPEILYLSRSALGIGTIDSLNSRVAFFSLCLIIKVEGYFRFLRILVVAFATSFSTHPHFLLRYSSRVAPCAINPPLRLGYLITLMG